MQTPEGITVVATNYQDVLALRKSDALAAVEQTIATQEAPSPQRRECHRATCSFCTNGLGSRISDWRCPRPG